MSHYKRIAHYFKVISTTFPRDMKGLLILKKSEYTVNKYKKKNATVASVFKDIVKKNPAKLALASPDTSWTFQELENYSNNIANVFQKAGFKPGDEVALLMESKPEFVGIWLGLSKIGVVTALLNTNQRLQTLLHSLKIVNARALIFDCDFESAVQDVVSIMPSDHKLELYSNGECKSKIHNLQRLDKLLEFCKSDKTIAFHKGNFNDCLFYIYTSGTTGLPKAAIIKHSRFFVFGTGIHIVNNFIKDDVLYTPLPLYHLAGGVLGLSQCLLYGNSVILRHKFSASAHWSDCIKYKCTIAQYIGETCRFLLTQPKDPLEKSHSVRTMFGNGLRPQIWKSFKERFGIKRIVEVYGATESNGSLLNIDNKEGACGFMSINLPSWLLRKIYPVSLVKVHPDTGDVLRDDNGLCIPCGPNECGQLIGKIEVNDPFKDFTGYVDKQESNKKIIKNVFKKGDAYFSSGDLLTMDEYGYLYFTDRSGDNIRWKGENISTGEVESIISSLSELVDCVVYGVGIPGYEGKAGMLAIHDPSRSLKLEKLLKDMQKSLPSYSIPLIIRLCDKIEMTTTFKLPKTALAKESFNPDKVKDPLFILDANKNCYVKLDSNTYNDLISGKFAV